MRERIVKALADAELDYAAQKEFVRANSAKGGLWQEAAVLALVTRRGNPDEPDGGWQLVFNKRSCNVPQPGDLCFPGGHPQPFVDLLTAKTLVRHLLPLKKSPGFALARQRDRTTFGLLTYFLAGALRETWEEMRLWPNRVDFLGGLPCHRMLTRSRIIYPMVGAIKKGVPLHKGREIEKVILAGFAELTNPLNYGTYRLMLTGRYKDFYGQDFVDMPCLGIKSPEGDEVLWGATYAITLSFLKTVLGFTPPPDGPFRAQAPLYPNQAAKG
jgi:8-oxo-dGTP pyrophosphatase MutT (NUDIX family)